MSEEDVAGSFSLKDVSHLTGLTSGRIRRFITSGFIGASSGTGKRVFSFQDVVLLRTAKALVEHVPMRKVLKTVERIREKLGPEQALSSVRIEVHGQELAILIGDQLFEVETGQGLMPLDHVPPDPEPEEADDEWLDLDHPHLRDAEQLFELAFDSEDGDPEQAREHYLEALERDPGHISARINLGRLTHQAGDILGALEHYRRAGALDPNHATAAFNTGVALEDLGRYEEALAAYVQAITLEPTLAEGYVNAARVCEHLQRKEEALQFLHRYRECTRRDS